MILPLFNTLGQEVAVLQNGEQEAGYHEVKFDALGLSSGVHFYRTIAGSYVQTRKLLLVRKEPTRNSSKGGRKKN